MNIEPKKPAPHRRHLHLVAGTLACVAGAASAGEHRYLPADMPAAYVAECGSCHAAYPPAFLPAASWRRITNGLAKHYGGDASLDAATVQTIDRWLQTHAGTYKRVREEPPQDRITRSAWFERKHRGVPANAWSHPQVKTAANCAACHTGTEQGLYDDDRLRTPPGLGWGWSWKR